MVGHCWALSCESPTRGSEKTLVGEAICASAQSCAGVHAIKPIHLRNSMPINGSSWPDHRRVVKPCWKACGRTNGSKKLGNSWRLEMTWRLRCSFLVHFHLSRKKSKREKHTHTHNFSISCLKINFTLLFLHWPGGYTKCILYLCARTRARTDLRHTDYILWVYFFSSLLFCLTPPCDRRLYTGLGGCKIQSVGHWLICQCESPEKPGSQSLLQWDLPSDRDGNWPDPNDAVKYGAWPQSADCACQSGFFR